MQAKTATIVARHFITTSPSSLSRVLYGNEEWRSRFEHCADDVTSGENYCDGIVRASYQKTKSI